MEALLIDLEDCKLIDEEPTLRRVGGHRTEGEWQEDALKGEDAKFAGEAQTYLSVKVHGNFDIAAKFHLRSRLGNLRTDDLETVDGSEMPIVFKRC